MKKGDIVLVPFPFTNLKGVKKRPSVVLYSGKFDLIVAFITSKLKSIEDLDVSLQPNRQNRLKETSVLKTNKLASIEKELIIGKIGELSEFQMKNLDIKLKQVFKLN